MNSYIEMYLTICRLNVCWYGLPDKRYTYCEIKRISNLIVMQQCEFTRGNERVEVYIHCSASVEYQ